MLDVDGWKYQFNGKNKRTHIETAAQHYVTVGLAWVRLGWVGLTICSYKYPPARVPSELL